MRVEIGNVNPHQMIDGQAVPLAHGQPAVTTFELDDDLTLEPGAHTLDLIRELYMGGMVTHLPDHEMFVAIMHLEGGWSHHGSGSPEWVHCESVADPDKATELERLLCEAWSCAHGRPDDVEDRFHTPSGPPGVGPNEG